MAGRRIDRIIRSAFAPVSCPASFANTGTMPGPCSHAGFFVVFPLERITIRLSVRGVQGVLVFLRRMISTHQWGIDTLHITPPLMGVYVESREYPATLDTPDRILAYARHFFFCPCLLAAVLRLAGAGGDGKQGGISGSASPIRASPSFFSVTFRIFWEDNLQAQNAARHLALLLRPEVRSCLPASGNPRPS